MGARHGIYVFVITVLSNCHALTAKNSHEVLQRSVAYNQYCDRERLERHAQLSRKFVFSDSGGRDFHPQKKPGLGAYRHEYSVGILS